MDKFADVSKKSPFSLFKKQKSRDPSPQMKVETRKKTQFDEHFMAASRNVKPIPIRQSQSDISEEVESEAMDREFHFEAPATLVPPEFGNIEGPNKQFRKTFSELSYQSEGLESETDMAEVEALMDMIDEYYYGVRIFPGQDPSNVYIGWVTPGFHMYASEFEMKKSRHVVVCTLDMDYKIKSR